MGINVDEAFMKIGLSVLDKILRAEVDLNCDVNRLFLNEIRPMA